MSASNGENNKEPMKRYKQLKGFSNKPEQAFDSFKRRKKIDDTFNNGDKN